MLSRNGPTISGECVATITWIAPPRSTREDNNISCQDTCKDNSGSSATYTTGASVFNKAAVNRISICFSPDDNWSIAKGVVCAFPVLMDGQGSVFNHGGSLIA